MLAMPATHAPRQGLYFPRGVLGVPGRIQDYPGQLMGYAEQVKDKVIAGINQIGKQSPPVGLSGPRGDGKSAGRSLG